MPINTYIAEGVASVHFETSRTGTIATGFNLTISDTADIEHDGEIEVGIEGDGSGVYTLGSKFGIILSDGVSRTRTHTGRTTVIVDPIMDLFKKAIIVRPGTDGNYLGDALGDSEGDKDFVVTLSSGDVMTANISLREGKVEKFIDIMFGMSRGRSKDIVILTDKVKDSPIIKNLSDIGASATSKDNGSFFTAKSFYSQAGIYTVESIFHQTLGPLGLELYWVKDNIYSLEPPRLTNPNAKNEPITILDSDIISIDSVSDPYNVPDLILPTITMPDIIATGGVDSIAALSLQMGVLSDMSGKRSMKIQTYEIPNILVDPVKIAMIGARVAKDKSAGAIPTLTSEEAIANWSTFFGSNARKSKLYKLSRGGCRLIFRPDITVPFSWYSIDGEDCFVTNIKHSITRSNAETQLTIAGKRNPDIILNDATPKIDEKIKEIEEKYIKTVIKKTEVHEEKVKSDSENVSRKINKATQNEDISYLSYCGRDLTNDELNLLFADEDELKEVLNKVLDVQKTIKV